jgi:hypothetical protein
MECAMTEIPDAKSRIPNPNAGRLAMVIAILAVSALDAQRSWTPPRTPDGQPDIQGIWVTFDSTPFEAPLPAAAAPQASAPPVPNVGPAPEFAVHDSPTSARRRSMVVEPADGRVPVLPWAEARRDDDLARIGDSWVHETPWVRCVTRGFPATMFPAGYNNAHQILQVPGYVIIASEMIHETRIIPLDGRPHLGASLRQWNGDSRGRWEGNTLVVVTTNFNDKGSIATSAATGRMRGVPQTSSMRVTERFTPVSPDRIDYEVTIDDPKAYARPWKVALPFNRDPEYQIFEYSCHEGNYSIPNELTAGRARDASSR